METSHWLLLLSDMCVSFLHVFSYLDGYFLLELNPIPLSGVLVYFSVHH